jgi:hypothetical protein
MDLRLIPMLAILYLLSFLDRGNIGNAKIQGMQTDLNLSGEQYNLCATVFVSLILQTVQFCADMTWVLIKAGFSSLLTVPSKFPRISS